MIKNIIKSVSRISMAMVLLGIFCIVVATVPILLDGITPATNLLALVFYNTAGAALYSGIGEIQFNYSRQKQNKATKSERS